MHSIAQQRAEAFARGHCAVAFGRNSAHVACASPSEEEWCMFGFYYGPLHGRQRGANAEDGRNGSALEALTVDGCIFAGDTNMHVDECISQQQRDQWDDAWEVDGADETLSGTWCQEWMETTHPIVPSWRFDRLIFQTRVIERNVVEPRHANVTAKQEASTSVDAAVTLLSRKQRKSQSDGVIFLSGKQKQRRARAESVCLVRNSFQRTWGVGMSDHACISGMFLVQAGATEGQLPEAEYLCVARPGLGPKVARRPAESESCAHKTHLDVLIVGFSY